MRKINHTRFDQASQTYQTRVLIMPPVFEEMHNAGRLSFRAAKALTRLGVTDISGITPEVLGKASELRNCGSATIDELARLRHQDSETPIEALEWV